MDTFVFTPLAAFDDPVELVERKGLGHPDTICDAIAEKISRALCREYRRRFGRVLHHNVDKALLCGGASRPAFGGGDVKAPIRMFLGGRAVRNVGNERVPVGEIAVEIAREWFKSNLHAFDAERYVKLFSEIRSGSLDLRSLFAATDDGIPRANDTSFGIGYAPLSALERLVLAAERRINSRDRASEHPSWGEDVKIMGVRCGTRVELTVACAMIGRYLMHIDDYRAEKCALADLLRAEATREGFPECDVTVNAADHDSTVYLTVTGTSAEAGDDGEVGRGNRVNGLITPGRPMSLEAAAGKNPVSHVGNIYNVLAQRVCEALTTSSPVIASAECSIVSRIGAPVTKPALVQIRLATKDGSPPARFSDHARAATVDALRSAPALVDAFIAGSFAVY
jgi:S-adenosylmethionine synthetase